VHIIFRPCDIFGGVAGSSRHALPRTLTKTRSASKAKRARFKITSGQRYTFQRSAISNFGWIAAFGRMRGKPWAKMGIVGCEHAQRSLVVGAQRDLPQFILFGTLCLHSRSLSTCLLSDSLAPLANTACVFVVVKCFFACFDSVLLYLESHFNPRST